MSNIVLNIVEPASPTPVDPGTGTVVPDTGLFTSGIGGAEAAIIATVTLVVILAIIGAVIYRKKKVGKGSTISLLTKCKQVIKSKKHAPGLAALALLVSIATVAGLVKLTTSAIEGDAAESTEDSSALTVDVSSTELTIELSDKPVFAVLPVDITVAEATDLGYTLTAHTEDTNLVSTTDSGNIIPMVASEDEPVALDANTYGLSLVDPESVADEVFTSLSTDIDNPTFITDKDYSATEANDTTTIYYGFYITPDTPYGTYTGSNIVVDAIPNLATITYNAAGLYYNDDESFTTNTVGYKPNIAESPIEEVVGEYLTPAPLTPVDPSTTIHYTFLGWSETEGATTPTYTNEEDILANLTLTKNESLTLYAVWHYNTVLSFNGTTSDGGTPIPDQTIAAGTTITLPHNTYTRTGSVFTGWNTAADGSGEAYADEAEFTAPDTSADITLYAQWAYTTTITFDANGGTGSMPPQTIVAGTPQNLTKNTFTKSNATFIGWNTVENPTPENPGTSYADEAEFVASTEEHQDITFYAQWAYTTISFNGNTTEPGTMDPITIAGGTTSNLPANTFTNHNCIFTGWNTNAEGTGISYGNSTPYQASATTVEEFTLYAQWQCISQVNYRGNGATGGEMNSSIILGGSTLTFPQNEYVRDGYIFNGWNTERNGTGTPYPDQGTFTAPTTPATTLNLYAQWKQVFYMQDVATWGSTLSQGDTMEAVDSRDGKSYWVAKLADGNIWMTQNLDLDIEAGKTYTSADTDLANSTISTSWTPTVSTSTTSSWTSSTTAPESYNPGDLYWDGTLNTNWDGNLSNETVSDPSATSGGTHYHIGNYYNWTAAVAMNDSSGKNSGDMNQSICPAGWRLPTYSGDKSYQNLVSMQSLTAGASGNIQNTPAYFVYGGYWFGSSYYVGSFGYYWSSVVESSNYAYLLYFGVDGDLNPQNYNYRDFGYSLRCVARWVV